MNYSIPYHKVHDVNNIAKIFLREVLKLHGLPKTQNLLVIFRGHFGNGWILNWIFNLLSLSNGLINARNKRK